MLAASNVENMTFDPAQLVLIFQGFREARWPAFPTDGEQALSIDHEA